MSQIKYFFIASMLAWMTCGCSAGMANHGVNDATACDCASMRNDANGVIQVAKEDHIEMSDSVSMKLNAVKPDNTMIVRISEIEVYPEYLDAYLEAAHTVGATSVREEPGVICIYPMQQLRDGLQIRILEIYASQEAYQNHIKTAHFQTYKQGTLHMVKNLDLVDMRQMAPETLSLIFSKAME